MTKTNWQTKKLSEICLIKPTKNGVKKRLADTAPVSFVPMESLGVLEKEFAVSQTRALKNVMGNYTYFEDEDVLLAKITPCFENGKLGIARSLTNGVGFGSSEYIVFRPSAELFNEYLFYFLSNPIFREQGRKRMTGAVGHKRVSKDFIENYRIPLPPLDEQKRIVEILDEVFEAAAKAKENAERNLQNARELFESILQATFARHKEGWIDRPLASLCNEITVGHVGPMKTKYKESGIPFLRSQNIRPFEISMKNVMFIDEEFNRTLKKSQLRPGDLAIVRTGYPGTAAVIPHELPNSNCSDLVIVRPGKEVSPHFLAAFFNSSFGKQLVLGRLVGAAQKHFNITAAKAIMLHVPPLQEQRAIVSRLDSFRKTIQKLESIYHQKLIAVEELKKSVLKKAFAGELTVEAQEVEVIPFPAQIPGISTTDLHAGVMGMGYELHEQHNRLDVYGHVKAEKTAHMVEAYLGIDLGRTPLKEAAGPNDYRRLKVVESRAKKAGFFDFRRDGDRYRVTKYRRFDDLIKKTREKLGDRIHAVEELLNVMLPMDTRQAEVFCTVFAAWNNLLIEGKQPADEEIIYEARENWHPDKLRISRDKFFNALKWLRTKNIVPQGKGKKVTAKAA